MARAAAASPTSVGSSRGQKGASADIATAGGGFGYVRADARDISAIIAAAAEPVAVMIGAGAGAGTAERLFKSKDMFGSRWARRLATFSYSRIL